MAVKFSDLTITSVETITCFDPVTGEFHFALDELQNATISHDEQIQEITGKKGRILKRIKNNKTVTVSGSNGLVSGGLMEAQLGSKFQSGAQNVMVPDYVTLVKDAGTTSAPYKYTAELTYPVEVTAFAESGMTSKVFGYDALTNTAGAEYAYNADASAAGSFSVAKDEDVTKITLFSESADLDGTEIVAYYTRSADVNYLENTTDATVSHEETMYIDCLGEDKCNNVYRIQYFIPTADFSGTFDFEMGDNQTIHNFEASALAGGCKTGDLYYKVIVFGEEVTD